MLDSNKFMSQAQANRVRFGPFEADLQTQELWKNSIRLKLGGQPFGILIMLLGRPGQLVTREEFRSELWSSDTFVDFDHGLNAAMNKLRECLNDTPDDPKYIETLPRRGYRFIAPVARLDVPAQVPASIAVATDAPLAVPPFRSVPAIPDPIRELQWEEASSLGRVSIRYRWIAMGVLILICLLSGLAAVLHRKPPIEDVTRIPAGGNVLAVMAQPSADPAFSPDGDIIAYRYLGQAGHPAGIYTTSLQDEKETQITQDRNDCCPAWSPDSKQLAYSRFENNQQTIFIVPAKGGAPQKLHSSNEQHTRGEVAWAPDGESVTFTSDVPNGGAQLFSISIKTGAIVPLTESHGRSVDLGPAYSPDGQFLAFVRRGERWDSLYMLRLQGGTPQSIVDVTGQIIGPPAWTPDGTAIVYASNQNGATRLWRTAASGGTSVQVPRIPDLSWYPSIPRRTRKLAYQNAMDSSSIIRRDSPLLEPHAPRVVVSSSAGKNESPVLSPNGKKLAFMSNRSGTLEIWVSDPDGSYPSRMTNLGGCGTPRWSPDSESIVFDSSARDGLYIVDVTGGDPRPVAFGGGEALVPSFSRDGQWIYFGSGRNGQDQVWKVSVNGGDPIQVTFQGGFAALESPDGKMLYYSKARFSHPEIWVVPAAGGPETLVSPLIRPGEWANWALAQDGIFFLDSSSSPTIEYFDFKTQQVRTVSTLIAESFWLSVSADGNSLWYDQDQHGESTILVQPNFH